MDKMILENQEPFDCAQGASISGLSVVEDRFAPKTKPARFLFLLSIGILPVALGFWYYLPVILGPADRVYLTYDSVLLYVSDAVGLIAVAAWGLKMALSHTALRFGQNFFEWLLLAIVVLATASVFWSRSPVVSIYTALHFWLLLALFVAASREPDAWRAAAVGCTVTALVQSVIGIAEFGLQTTTILRPLGMAWPGDLSAAVSGASVVQLLDGTRFLRAYGALPHPNILGGMLTAWMAGPAGLFLAGGKRRWWAAAVFGLATIALTLTFSRSAWVGLAAGALMATIHFRVFDRRRLLALALAAIVCGLAAVIPARALIFTRVSGAPVSTEIRSTLQRLTLTGQSLAFIRKYPWGVGAGAYLTVTAVETEGDYPVEPVHNVYLLAANELGVAGGVLWLAVAIGVVIVSLRNRAPQGALLSAVVVGLLAMAVFDHYLWSLPPGRTLLWLFLGLWAGHVRRMK